jgi:formate hydrogenlyase subunit 6/NADH:ubiquinone oxidoreductase subunit I
MGYLTDSVRAMRVTMRNLMRPPTTVHYPHEDRVRPERYRTSFALLHDADGDEACIACLACERICPSRIITVKTAGKRESPYTGKKRNYLENLTLDLNACIFCELCVQVCPADAIIMLRELAEPALSREDLFLTMERLYANEARKPSWGTGSLLMEMQNPKRGEVKADTPVDRADGAATPVDPADGAGTPAAGDATVEKATT